MGTVFNFILGVILSDIVFFSFSEVVLLVPHIFLCINRASYNKGYTSNQCSFDALGWH